MRITNQQQGPIAQNEFAKFAILGSNGELELDPALTDDDGRDVEVHRRRRFGLAISIQVKSVLKLQWNHKTRSLRSTFHIPEAQLGGNRYFWFFFAFLDPTLMEFADPCFLVPSLALYRRAPRGRSGKLIRFTFDASMWPASRDQWSRYRVETRQIGQRLLAILHELEADRFGSPA
jgi:hypothetical protein